MEIEIVKIPINYNGLACYQYLGEQQHDDQKLYWGNGNLWEHYFCIHDSWEKIYMLFNHNGSRDNLTYYKNNQQHGINVQFIYKLKLKK